MTVDGSVEEVVVSTVVEPVPISVSIIDKSINAIIQDDSIDVDLIAYDTMIGSPVLEEDEVYDVETDFSVPGVYYIGQAAVGSSTSDAVWRIRRVTENLNGTSIDWAGGTAEFIHIWDNRLNFVYGP